MTLAEQVRGNLRSLIALYCAATGRGPSGVCANAIGNASFYKRTIEGETKITAETYDDLVAWLSANWHDNPNFPWPPTIERPVTKTARR